MSILTPRNQFKKAKHKVHIAKIFIMLIQKIETVTQTSLNLKVAQNVLKSLMNWIFQYTLSKCITGNLNSK